MTLQERLNRQAAKLQRRGANPRRADPLYTQPVTLTKRQAVGYAIGLLVCGMAFATLGLIAIAFAADLRPAHPGDIRLAGIVRGVIPHADSASEAELEVQLAMPPALSQALAPIVTSDPRWTALNVSWLAPLVHSRPIVLDEDRIVALGELLTTLAAIGEPGRGDTIRDIVNLYVATLSPDTRTLINRIAGLPRDLQRRLVESRAFVPLLSDIGALSEPQRQALADSHLQLMPSNPERMQLIVNIPRLDVPVIRLINELGALDPRPRQALIYAVNEIRSGSPQLLSVLSLYADQDPRLLQLIANAKTEAREAAPRRRRS